MLSGTPCVQGFSFPHSVCPSVEILRLLALVVVWEEGQAFPLRAQLQVLLGGAGSRLNTSSPGLDIQQAGVICH